jgi:hypothetical protein
MSETRAEHHYTVNLNEIPGIVERAKERDNDERAKARAEGKKVLFRHPDKLEWGGYVFEEVFGLAYPDFKPISRKYGTDLKDYESTNGWIYELKCPSNLDSPFGDHFKLSINQSQVGRSQADIFVVGFYFVRSPQIRICGWLNKEDIPEKGQLLKKGEKFPNSRDKLVSSDCYSIRYMDIEKMSDLPQ